MSSVSVNRKTIRRAVKRGKRITGVDLTACAVAVVTKMGLHPSSTRKVFEILLKLEQESWLRLVGGQLRPWTPEAQKAELVRRIAARGQRQRKGKRKGDRAARLSSQRKNYSRGRRDRRPQQQPQFAAA